MMAKHNEVFFNLSAEELNDFLRQRAFPATETRSDSASCALVAF